MARQGRARAASQNGKALVEPGIQLGHRHHPQPGGAQLDGQRHAVQPPADAADDRSGPLVPGERHPMLGGAVGEEPHRLRVTDRAHVIAVGWRAHGGDPVDALALDAQRLTAGREQPDVRAVPKQDVGELGARVEDVLAVVQQHEQAPLADRFDERADDGAARVLRYGKHIRDGDRDEIRVLKRGEIRKPHPVAGAIQQPGRDLERKAGLARAARAGERDQTRDGDQPVHLSELGVAADKARHLRREIIEQPRVVERPKRRESRWKAVGLELEDLLGPAEVLQPVQAEVPEGGARRQRVAEQGSRRSRNHDLPPVGDCRDTGSAVDVETDQAGGCLGRLTGVDAHPDPDCLTGWPRVRNERPLHLNRRSHASPRRGEYREERVALRVDLLAAMRGEAGPDQPMVVGENLRVRIAQALQQRRGTLDVSEEKGERLRSHRPEAPCEVDTDVPSGRSPTSSNAPQE